MQPIDIGFIKIDKTFVRHLDSNPGDLTLCRSIIMMAHGMGIKVVAEGVERIEQVKRLRSLGGALHQPPSSKQAWPPDRLQ